MEGLYRRLANRPVVWLALFLNLLAVAAFTVLGQGLAGGNGGIVALQLAFSTGNFAQILAQWGPAGIHAYQTTTLWVDSWFPPAYALLLSSLIAVLATRTARPPSRFQLILFALPWLAMVLDWLENSLHLILLRNPSNLSAILVLIASLAAAIKWGLLAASILSILYLVVSSAQARLNRRAG